MNRRTFVLEAIMLPTKLPYVFKVIIAFCNEVKARMTRIRCKAFVAKDVAS